MQEESMKNSMEFYEDTLRSIEEGEIIQGTVLKIDKEEIFVDVKDRIRRFVSVGCSSGAVCSLDAAFSI